MVARDLFDIDVFAGEKAGVPRAEDVGDPVRRLKLIHDESEQAKALARGGSMSMIEIFQMMPPILISGMMDSVPAEQLPQMLGANLIVSNVRGSPLPMYIAGARMEKMYPVSILTAGIGINVKTAGLEAGRVARVEHGFVIEEVGESGTRREFGPLVLHIDDGLRLAIRRVRRAVPFLEEGAG